MSSKLCQGAGCGAPAPWSWSEGGAPCTWVCHEHLSKARDLYRWAQVKLEGHTREGARKALRGVRWTEEEWVRWLHVVADPNKVAGALTHASLLSGFELAIYTYKVPT